MQQQQDILYTPVLIVGGGVVGLSAALLLVQQGVVPLLIEKHSGTSIHPRARGFDIRTMEIYRNIGIGEAIREAGKALAPAWGILAASSLAAAMEKRKPRKKKDPGAASGVDGLADLSPETGARCTQDLSEPVLLAAARERGADIRFGMELVSFTQNMDGVEALVLDRNRNVQQTIVARYLIACDGAKSGIREALGVGTTGQGALGNLLNIYFEANLGEIVRDREFSILLIRQEGLRGMLTSINNSDRWVFHLHYDAEKEDASAFTTQRITGILHRALGLESIVPRVISILPWQPTVKVVNEMQHGRIFLAGDAAHVMTPYGGKGANTGIQDAQNLAWKLAAVLQDKAAPDLLSTYSTERQPIGLANSLASAKWTDRYGLLSRRFFVIIRFAGAMILGKLRQWLGKGKSSGALPMVANVFGLPDYQYSSSREYTRTKALDGRPGTRVPHYWVTENGKSVSTLDLLGKDFVLFTSTESGSWKEAAAKTARALNIDLPVYTAPIGAEALLVRPDGFVAWRWEKQTARPQAGLEEVVNRQLLRIL